MKNILVWLTFARSGTNYLSDLVGCLPNVESYRDIFSPGGVHAYCAISERTQVRNLIEGLSEKFEIYKNRDLKHQGLVSLSRNRPRETIEALSSLSTKDIISFKLVSNHLSFEVVREIIRMPQCMVLVMIRNPLDTYISGVKTQATGVNLHVDTTGIKVDLDVENYKSLLRRRRRWIELMNKNADFIHGFINYEDLIAISNDVNRIYALQKILHGGGLSVGEGVCEHEGLTQRQDKESDPSKKVNNYTEFHKCCVKEGVPLDKDLVNLQGIKNLLN